MFTSELSALAMLRWHEGFNAAGGGCTGFLIGAMAAALLVLEYRGARRANAEYATCKVLRRDSNRQRIRP